MLYPFWPAAATLILFYLSASCMVYGQKIDDKLFYKSAYITTSVPPTPVLEAPVPRKADKDDREKFLSQWKDLLIATHDNLLDDSLFLQRDYELLWEGFYKDFIAEIAAAIVFCDTETDTSGLTYKYIPAPADVLTFLNSQPLVEVKKKSSEMIVNKWQVIRSNLFEKWLYEWFKSQITANFPYQDIDINYIKDWRNLEYIFNNTAPSIDTLTELINKKWDMVLFKRTFTRAGVWTENITKSSVLKYIQSDDNLSKKSLWFTKGILQMNPLLVTDPRREYPSKERNSFLPPRYYHEMDSLKKIKFLRQLFATNKVYNEISIPIVQPDQHIRYVQYDAANNYTADNEPNGMIDKKTEKLTTVVHNLPADKAVEFKVTGKESVPNKSRAQLQVEEVLGPVGEVVKLFNPLAAVAGKLLTKPVLTAKLTIPPPAVNLYALPLGDSGINSSVVTSLNQLLFPGEPEDDEINTLLTSFFVMFASPTPFDDRKPKASLKKLKDEFQQFLFAFAETLIDDLTEQRNLLLPVIRIYNRSLPPSRIEEYTDNATAFSTTITETDLPAATAKVSYVLIEKGERPADQKQVAQTSFTLAKRIYWNISAGINYTFFKEYVVTPQVSSGVPDIQPANHSQFAATLHVYPWGINNLNDRFGGRAKERISIYAGLGITRPLDNYYGGMSYDLWPGFKLMAGVHYYRKARYEITNDQVTEKATKLDWMGPTLGFHIDYTTLGTILGFFK